MSVSLKDAPVIRARSLPIRRLPFLPLLHHGLESFLKKLLRICICSCLVSEESLLDAFQDASLYWTLPSRLFCVVPNHV